MYCWIYGHLISLLSLISLCIDIHSDSGNQKVVLFFNVINVNFPWNAINGMVACESISLSKKSRLTHCSPMGVVMVYSGGTEFTKFTIILEFSLVYIYWGSV